MEIVKNVFKVFALATAACAFGAIAWVMVETALVVRTVPQTVERAREDAIAQIDLLREETMQEIMLTRLLVDEKLTQGLLTSDLQLTALREEVLAEARALRLDAGARIDAGLARVDETLLMADAAGARLDGVVQHVESTLTNVDGVMASGASIATQVDEELPKWLECRGNADCLFLRYVGMSREMERSAKVFNQHFPELAANTAKTSKNISKMTDPLSPTTIMRGLWTVMGALAGR